MPGMPSRLAPDCAGADQPARGRPVSSTAGDVSISLSGKALTVASRRTESLLVIRSQINAEDGIKCASQPLAGTEAAERDGGNGPRLLNSYCIHSYCIHAAAFSA